MGEFKNYVTQNELAGLAVGVVGEKLSQTSAAPPPPAMVQVVILEVISDPIFIVNTKKKNYWSGVLGVSNMSYADVLPRNTIIAQELGGVSKPLFCFPFFPSHLSLPSKAGEVVWAVKQNPAANVIDIMYWMCKVVQPHFVDDVNHTHMPRLHEPSLSPDMMTRQENDGKPDAWNELRNGPVNYVKIDGKRVRKTVPHAQYIVSKQDDIFESIATETDAGRMMQYETVPRFRKRPGDLALEGSNNTLLVLGTDRSGPAAQYAEGENQLLIDKSTDENFKTSLRPQIPPSDLNGSAGSIDMVAGRGQTIETFGNTVSTTRLKDSKGDQKGSELKKELDKVIDLQKNEGDPDFLNDRSRVLIAQRINSNEKFGLSSYNGRFKDPTVSDGASGAGAVVIKSDKVKIVARSDVQIVVVGSQEAPSPSGTAVMRDEIDTSKWASITIKSNGDIVFAPSQKGYIKLGSDEANKAILCTDQPAQKLDGTVKAKAISDTAAGFVGTGAANQGTWAKKILVD